MKPPTKPRHLELPEMEKTEIVFDGSGLTFTQGAEQENTVFVPMLYLSSFLAELQFALYAPEDGGGGVSSLHVEMLPVTVSKA